MAYLMTFLKSMFYAAPKMSNNVGLGMGIKEIMTCFNDIWANLIRKTEIHDRIPKIWTKFR
jgi:hypothetical protein